MRSLLGTTIVAITAMWPVATMAQVQTFVAALTGAQEVPPVVTAANGFGQISIDPATGSFELVIDVNGITRSQITFASGPFQFAPAGGGPLHIHRAAAGANGPITVRFPEPGNYIDKADGSGLTITALGSALTFGTGASLSSVLDDLNSGNAYFNLHSLQFPSGQIRGQLARVSEPASLALLGLGSLSLAAVARRRRKTKPTV
jgi:hypothetical protein